MLNNSHTNVLYSSLKEKYIFYSIILYSIILYSIPSALAGTAQLRASENSSSSWWIENDFS
jgi:hypothetical protein